MVTSLYLMDKVSNSDSHVMGIDMVAGEKSKMSFLT
jgi:hypothetical protein